MSSPPVAADALEASLVGAAAAPGLRQRRSDSTHAAGWVAEGKHHDDYLPDIQELLERRIAHEEEAFEGLHRAGGAAAMSHLVVHELESKLRWRPLVVAEGAAAAGKDYSGYYKIMETLASLLETSGCVLLDIPEYSSDGIIDRFLAALVLPPGGAGAGGGGGGDGGVGGGGGGGGPALAQEDAKEIRRLLRLREAEYPDALGDMFNIYMAQHPSFLDEPPVLAFARLARPVNFDAPDGLPTRFVWLMLGAPTLPGEQDDDMVALGEGVALIMSDPLFHDLAVSAGTASGQHSAGQTAAHHRGHNGNGKFGSPAATAAVVALVREAAQRLRTELTPLERPQRRESRADWRARERIVSLTQLPDGIDGGDHGWEADEWRRESDAGSNASSDESIAAARPLYGRSSRRFSVKSPHTHRERSASERSSAADGAWGRSSSIGSIGSIGRGSPGGGGGGGSSSSSSSSAAAAAAGGGKAPSAVPETIGEGRDEGNQQGGNAGSRACRSLWHAADWRGGVGTDWTHRVALHWRAEFAPAMLFHRKTMRAAVLILFVVVAPAVAFGAVNDKLTKGAIGATETLAGTAAMGMLYALVGGMPMVIIGSTGPLVIFTGLLYKACDAYGIPFLAARFWVSAWVLLFSLLAALFRLSTLVRFVTRFTDEIFSAHISGIFVIEAVSGLGKPFTAAGGTSREAALLGLVAGVGTCWFSLLLRSLRRGRLMRAWVRELLSDFSNALAILVVSLLDRLLLQDVETELVAAQAERGPLITTSGRAWMVDPMELNGNEWVIWASALPALVGMGLIFLDNIITWHVVNAPENKLERGPAVHYDTVVMGVMTLIAGTFGFPWVVAADGRSVSHLHALADKEELTAHGRVHEHVMRVHEGRWSGLLVHAALGLLALQGMPVIHEIPMSVMYGFFLFCGIVSLGTNQFIERLQLFLTEPALYPPTHYIRNVPIGQINRFTATQLLLLVALIMFKNSPAGLFFPVFILLLVPLRIYVLPHIIPEHYLATLDQEEEIEDHLEQGIDG